MKMSDGFFITRKEFPSDEETISAKLLIKSGMILKNSNGIFSYLPMGLKVIKNVTRIIENEMNKEGCYEVLMPSLVDSEIFNKSKRRELLGKEIYSLKDRNDNEYNLCPTHEELFTILARNKINSYKDLHFILYQISNKFRDEEKVKYGLIRKKEFLMADAYSFDTDDFGMDISYDKMNLIFKRIFKSLGLNVITSESDASEMNGSFSEEFLVPCESGESKIVKCSKCNYVASINYAKSYDTYKKSNIKILKKKEVYTPNIESINDLVKCLKIRRDKIIKSLIYKVNNNYVMVLLRGDAQINEKKLCKLLKCNNITMIDKEELKHIGTIKGYVGPIKSTMKIIADNEVKSMFNAVCGTNKENYHYINVNPGIDFKVEAYADIKLFNDGSLCPKCKSKCYIINSIEVGHIFKLGTSYSEKYNLRYLDETNKLNNVYMSSYGIGIERCISSIVEYNHDEKGIIWPIKVAPYKVCIILINPNEKAHSKYANDLYKKLNEINIDTILDDRKVSLGIKLNDMDLIGIPIRITIGYEFINGIVELKLRNEKESINIYKDKVIKEIINIINKE